MKRKENYRADRMNGLEVRARRKSLPPDPRSFQGSSEMIYDVSGSQTMLLRVCWERKVAAVTVVQSHERRPTGRRKKRLANAERMKEISIQHTIRDIRDLVEMESCLMVIDAPLPCRMNWEEALKFRNNYGRRVREKFERRKTEPSTFLAVVTTRYAKPYGIRVFCPNFFENQTEVFLSSTYAKSPKVRLIHPEGVPHEVHEMHNDLALVPDFKKRYFVSRGNRLEIESFEIGSIEEGRELLRERLGPGYKVVVTHSQIFGKRQRAELLIVPMEE